MSNKQQTALDIVISQLKEQIEKSAHKDASTIRTGDYRIGLTKAIEFCEKAKEMEKEKIVDAMDEGFNDGIRVGQFKEDAKFSSGEQYYNEKYI